MFEAAEVGQKLSKEDHAEREPELRLGLLNAQYDLQHTRSAVVALIAGDDRHGATGVLNLLGEWMDGRYLDIRAFGPPTEAERLRPDFWRYWTALPPRGRVALYLGGWVQNLLARQVEGRSGESDFDRSVERFTNFERMLSADGTVFVKLWMHLPKREHEKRIAKARKERGDTWRVDEIDWHICDNFDALAPLAEDLLQRTTTEETRWRVIESTDSRHRNVACAERVLEAIEGAIALAPRAAPKPPAPAPAPTPSVLDRVDLSESLPQEEYKSRLEEVQRELFKFVERAEERELRTMLVFEGWDAAGKGGVIRRITHALDARDYSVVPMGAPTEEEQRYHYLWRFWRHVPRAGKMLILDRSWYGRVLVERVEGFTLEADWQRAYKEINAFEQELTEANTVLLKFWLHIDADEQLRRFRDREKTPYKKYKITDEDYRNRDQWDAYVAAVHDMVEHTSTQAAPWHLVPANDKRFARVQVIETVRDAVKAASKKGKKG